MAYAGAEFAAKVIRAVGGEKGIVAPSFVNLAADKVSGEALKKEIGKELEYFSAPIELGVSFAFVILFSMECWLLTRMDIISPRVLLASAHSVT